LSRQRLSGAPGSGYPQRSRHNQGEITDCDPGEPLSTRRAGIAQVRAGGHRQGLSNNRCTV